MLTIVCTGALQSGLVIVRASYGTPAAIEAADAESRQQRHSGQQQDQQQQQRRRSDLEDTAHFEQEQHSQQAPASGLCSSQAAT